MYYLEWKERIERFWRSSIQGLGLPKPERVAIDIGAANTRIFQPGIGVVINEPSVIAYDTETGKVAAAGQEAKTLVRRKPRNIRIMRPTRDGVIADCEVAGQMLAQFLRRVLMSHGLTSLSTLICVPAEITPLEQKAYEDAAIRAGAKKVTLIEAVYAASVGAGLNLRSSCASMMVDLGAATTDVAVTSGGAVLHASTQRIGGNEIDRSILRYLRMERALEVSEETAEDIKIKLGRIDSECEKGTMTVRGRNLKTGLPEENTIAAEEIQPLIQPVLRIVKQHMRTALEEIPTGSLVDLLDTGITLSGGLAQLPGLSGFLNQEFGLRVDVAPDPILSATLGAGRLIEDETEVTTQEVMKEQESISRFIVG